jgi:pimeloyl-ACP methyl ester carboxylesterase
MVRSAPVDGFSLAYERSGAGPPVVLLHGWPGDHTDHEALVPLLTPDFEVVVPDLRGFGESDRHPEPPVVAYSAEAQARSVVGLIDELGLERPVIAGYDIGSRIAQAIARDTPEIVRALVVSPPLPGAGKRILTPGAMREFWYQSFHQLSLIEEILDGDPVAVRAYLAHFWNHWSGPAFTPTEARLDHLAAAYGEPGAMTASIGWYRAGSGGVARALAEEDPAREDRIAAPTTVLWQEHDPLCPRTWSDRLGVFFARVEMVALDGIGHFTPVEAPEAFAAAIRDAR